MCSCTWKSTDDNNFAPSRFDYVRRNINAIRERERERERESSGRKNAKLREVRPVLQNDKKYIAQINGDGSIK